MNKVFRDYIKKNDSKWYYGHYIMLNLMYCLTHFKSRSYKN